MSRRLRLAAAALALVALSGPAAAQQPSKQPTYVTPPPSLRPPEPAPQPAPRRKPPPRPAAQEQPASPALSEPLPPTADTTARIGGLEPEKSGGAQCRADCAQTYYFCLANQEGDSCQTSWTQCLIACPTNSSSF